MSIKALQDYTFVSRYARYIPELKRRETWDESIERVRDMQLEKYAGKGVDEDIIWAYEQVKQKKVLGSQRALQFGGKPLLKHNSRNYNCTVSYCDRLRFFQEAMYLLLCGCGVGFSVQRHHIDKLPELRQPYPTGAEELREKVFVIPDSIEGWADAVGVLVSSFFEGDVPFPEYQNTDVTFDYSLIRPKGSPLSNNVGKAPGSDGLRNSIEKIRVLLDRCIEDEQTRLRPIDAYDIIMHSSDAVLSGGVRRSATICLFSPDDEEMATAKTGDWGQTNPQRARSNNSALLIRETTTKEEFLKLMEHTKEHGEPGFIWADSTEALFNPSLRGDTKVITKNGIFPIKDLENKVIYVKNLYGKWSKAKCRLSGKNKKLYKITLMGGKEYYATKEHKWPVYTNKNSNSKNRNLEKKETHELVAGDLLTINHEIELFDGQLGDYDDGFLIGWLYGDGWITKRKDNGVFQYGICVSKKDAENGILQKLNEIIEKKLGFKPNWTNRESTYEGNWQRKSIHEYFLRFGVSDKSNGIPSMLWTDGSEDLRKGFVDGILSADGSVNNSLSSETSEILFSSSREKLSKDLQELFGFYGIKTWITHSEIKGSERTFPNGKIYKDKTYHSHMLRIQTKDSLRHFVNIFKISHEEKMMKFNKWKNSDNILNSFQSTIKIKTIEETNIYEDVWDISVYDQTHCFQLSNCITGNCVEIGFIAYDEQGRSGWHFCNLTEGNGKKFKTEEQFYEGCKALAIIGTLQAGWTSFPYLGEVSENIVKREALLGCSVTGLMDSPDILLDPKIQRKGAKIILEVNNEISKKIGINPTARATCVKPAGTTSLILGTASGIHPHHAKRYFRRVQANSMEAPLQEFKKLNPKAVEVSVWSANNTDEIITFCVEVPDGTKLKNQMSAIELLEIVRETKKNWVDHGKVEERCVEPWLSHNVSNTINVKDDEWHDVANFIYRNRAYFAGISLLPISGDKDYAQAPNCTVYTPNEMVKEYGDASVFASGVIEVALTAFNGNLWEACDILLGTKELTVGPMKTPLHTIDGKMMGYAVAATEFKGISNKLGWLEKAKNFADKYFDGDLKRMTYCLKDIHGWYVWTNLRKSYEEVDYTQMREEEDNTNIEESIACGGGACEVTL